MGHTCSWSSEAWEWDTRAARARKPGNGTHMQLDPRKPGNGTHMQLDPRKPGNGTHMQLELGSLGMGHTCS